MHNPFRRADKHGAPDMRVTAPPSAERPMDAPWVLCPPDNTMIVVGDVAGDVIGMAFQIHTGFEQSQVNARKMVAAPALLAALEGLVDDPESTNYCDFCGGSSEYIDVDPVAHTEGCPMAAAYAAIAKAKGETP